jgi:hypothetical protein
MEVIHRIVPEAGMTGRTGGRTRGWQERRQSISNSVLTFSHGVPGSPPLRSTAARKLHEILHILEPLAQAAHFHRPRFRVGCSSVSLLTSILSVPDSVMLMTRFPA